MFNINRTPSSDISNHGTTVAILGGGVAGLSCALALKQRAGLHNVQVFEQASAYDLPFRKGHGLMLMQNGVKALEALHMTHLLRHCTPLKQAIFINAQGETLTTERLKNVYCMSRSSLVDGMLAKLPEGVVRYDQPCQNIDLSSEFLNAQVGKKVSSIQFGSARLTDAGTNLFVDATGYRSPLCQTLNPDMERPVSRVHEVVTSSHLPKLAAQLGNRFIKLMMPEQGLAFGVLAPTPERVIGFLQFDSTRYSPPPRQASADDMRIFLQGLFWAAPEPISTYLRQADFSTAHVWRPINADIPTTIHCANAIAIGDAAHPLLPFTSQGVSAALADSIKLSDDISNLQGDMTSLPQTLHTFSETRRRDLNVYVSGGRRILANFLNPTRTRKFVAPYIETTTKTAIRPISKALPVTTIDYRTVQFQPITTTIS
ncbi:MAG: NAD(P)/FAD-dependent oxidoreductase [Chloroflexota bacterium]